MRKPLKYWISQLSVGGYDGDSLWRSKVEMLWREGAVEFRKVPMKRLEDWSLSIVGPPRPIACPEITPPGTEFALYSFDGIDWTLHDIQAFWLSTSTSIEENRAILDQAIHSVRGLWWSIMELISGNKNPTFKEFSNWPVALQWPAREDSNMEPRFDVDLNDLASVFAAGVSYGRAQVKLAERKSDRISEESGIILREIAKAALERHGEKAPLKLLEAMGGVRIERSNPYVWKFATGQTVDQEEFRKAVNAVKTDLKRP